MAVYNIGRLVISIATDLGRLQKGFQKSRSMMTQWGASVSRVGASLTRRLTMPMALVAGGALRMSATFDKSMARSTAIMGNLSKAMRKDLARTAREVAKETTFAARETADAYYFLASAGLDAVKSMEALPLVTKFAVAGQFDLATATDLLTDAQSALGLTVQDNLKNYENMRHVSDALVAANTLANASVQQFSEALTNKAGPALRATGKSVEEGLAVLAAFADQGIKGSEAGTQLGIVMRDLQTKALRNSEAFEELNVKVFDTSGEMRHLWDIVEDLERAMDGMSDEQKRAKFEMLGFADRSVAATMALLGLSKRMREYHRDIKAMQGITAEVAEKQMDNLADKFKMLIQRMGDVAISIGHVLTPGFTMLLEGIEGITEAVDKVSQSMEDFSPALKKVTGAVAAFLIVIGPLLLVLPKIVGAVKWLALTGVPALGAAMLFLARHPLAVLGVAAFKLFDRISELVKGTGSPLDKMISSFGLWSDKSKALKGELQGVRDVLKEIDPLSLMMFDLMQRTATRAAGFPLPTPAGGMQRAGVAAGKGVGRSTARGIAGGMRGLGGFFKKPPPDTRTPLQDFFGPAFEGVLSSATSGLQAVGRGSQYMVENIGKGIAAFEQWAVATAEADARTNAWRVNLQSWVDDVTNVSLQISNVIIDTFDSIAQGIGDAIAAAIVYTQDFGKMFTDVMKQIAASVISSLVRIGIQQLLSLVLTKGVLLAENAAKMAAYSMQTSAAAFANIIGPATAMFTFGGIGAAVGYATAAVASMLGEAGTAAGLGAAAGAAIPGFREGGLVMSPTIARVGEVPEIIAPISKVGKLIGGQVVTILEVDGRTLAKVVAPHTPAVIRKRIGARGS